MLKADQLLLCLNKIALAVLIFLLETHSVLAQVPAPILDLGLNNNLIDNTGIHTNVTAVSLSYSSDVANASCGSASMQFSGGVYGQLNNYLSLPNVANPLGPDDVNLNTGKPFSITAWSKTTGSGVIVAKSRSDSAIGNQTPLLSVDGNGYLHLDVFGVNGFSSTQGGLLDGKWHHISWTYDGSINNFYLDGVFAGKASFLCANEGASGEGPWTFTIGATLNPNYPTWMLTLTAPFPGKIDEVGVWPLALTSAQVDLVYSNGIPSVGINISQQPVNVVVVPGLTPTYSVGASYVGNGAPLTYQWQSNGVNIVYATNASYKLQPVSLSDNSTVYQCVVHSGSVFAISGGATLTVVPSQPPSGPILWLGFDGTAVDKSSQHLSIQTNGVKLSSDVANARCGTDSLLLAGGIYGQLNSYVAVPNIANPMTFTDINFNLENQFTVAAWVKTTGPGVIAAKSRSDSVIGNQTPLFSVDGNGYLHLDVFGVNGFGSTQGGLLDGNWHYVAWTYDGRTNTLYIDGIACGQDQLAMANEGYNGEGPWTFTAGATLNTNYPSWMNSLAAPFPGMIDEMAVWNSTLGLAQIGDLFLSGAPGPSILIAQQPVGASVLVGKSANFKLQATGIGVSTQLTYQWCKNGTIIDGATQNVYQTPPITLADDGAVFTCAVQGGNASTISDSAPLAIEGRGRVQLDNSLGFPRLVTDKGTLLRGVDLSWDSGGGWPVVVPTLQQLIALKSSYGLNCVHVYLENYATTAQPGANASICDQLVKLCRQAGIYLIITIGNTGSANINGNNGTMCSQMLQFAEDFWGFYAPRYAHEPHVIYEAQNEPHNFGTETWQYVDWKNQIALYNIIRSRAPDTHIFLCSFVALDQAAPVLANLGTLKEGGVAFSNASIAFHLYTVQSQADAAINTLLHTSGTPPLICTEWNFDDPTNMIDFTEMLEKYQVGWSQFCWFDPNNTTDLQTFKANINVAGVPWTPDYSAWPALSAASIPNGQDISLRAISNGQLVSIDNSGTRLIANRLNLTPAECFRVNTVAPGFVSLRSWGNNGYVTANATNLGVLDVTGSSVGMNQYFEWIELTNGNIVLKGVNGSLPDTYNAGSYVTAWNAGAEPLKASNPSVGSWEQWSPQLISNLESVFSLKLVATLSLDQGAITLSWPTNYTSDFILEMTPTLSPPKWRPVPGTLAIVGGNYQYSILATGNQYFRLHNPE